MLWEQREQEIISDLCALCLIHSNLIYLKRGTSVIIQTVRTWLSLNYFWTERLKMCTSYTLYFAHKHVSAPKCIKINTNCRIMDSPFLFILQQQRHYGKVTVAISSKCFRFVIVPINYDLTHWGRETHICVSKLTIIGSDNGLSPGRHQAIIWTNARILPLGTNFSEISINIRTFSFKKSHFNMSSGKWRPFEDNSQGSIPIP